MCGCVGVMKVTDDNVALLDLLLLETFAWRELPIGGIAPQARGK